MTPFTPTAALTDEDFHALRALIHTHAGIHLSDSKRALVSSRLSKRLRQLHLPSYTAYRDHLAGLDHSDPEWQEMINAITTNKTEFFREPHHFEFLRETIFPELERKVQAGAPRRLRIWSAGCSTGEEPYTLAMTLYDHFGSMNGWDVRILASDIDTEVLRHAEQGIYTQAGLSGIPESLQRRCLLVGKGSAAGTYRVRPELQQWITFRRINLNDRPWPIRCTFDFIFCRNVLIYFDRKTQEQILSGFLQKLPAGGHLFLGHSENVTGIMPELHPLGSTIYKLASTHAARPATLLRPATTFRAKSDDPPRGTAPQTPAKGSSLKLTGLKSNAAARPLPQTRRK